MIPSVCHLPDDRMTNARFDDLGPLIQPYAAGSDIDAAEAPFR
jgi:hypothetical protein